MTAITVERVSGLDNAARVKCTACGGRVVCDIRAAGLIRSYLERRHQCPRF